MKILLLILFFPLQVIALETDNYIVWGQTLKDSSLHINHYFAENIAIALQTIPEHSRKSCEQMTKLIAKNFTSHLVHDNPVENWLFRKLSSEEMYPTNMNYVHGSIYREPYLFYIPWFGLAPNIQVNDFYFGTDKLSHFASTGMIYYKIFIKELKKKKSHEDAARAAIHWGIRDEKTLHGFWASGVFSYADLEANYQGLLFYRNFCEGEQPYLKKNHQGDWELSRKPKIQDFVSGYWDETFELSYRLPANWEKVRREIGRYCQDAGSLEVRARINYYLQSPQSFSRKYLRELILNGVLPSTDKLQSPEEICAVN